MSRRTNRRTKIIAVWVGIIAGCATIVGVLLNVFQDKPQSTGDTYNTSSQNQRGGITAARVDIITTSGRYGRLTQATDFAEQLKINPVAIRIYYEFGSDEAKKVSIMLANILRGAGWDVYAPGALGVGGEYLADIKIIPVVATDEAQLDILNKKLNSLGILSMISEQSPYMGLSDRSQIIVGTDFSN